VLPVYPPSDFKIEQDATGRDEVANAFQDAADWIAGACANPSSLVERLSQLHTTLAELGNPFGEVRLPSLTQSEDALEARLLQGPNPFSGAALDVFKRYDKYFNLRRIADAAIPKLLHQLYITASLVVTDLRFCTMDLAEYSALLKAIAQTFRASDSKSVPITPAPTRFVPSSSESLGIYEGDLESVALYRWKLSHHLFNLLTTAASGTLNQASTASTQEEAAAAMDRAAILLRGTTAAMWYGEAWPPSIYIGHIRPSMAAARGASSGFSGRDNLEFHYFKQVVQEVVVSLQERFGDRLEWSTVLRDSVVSFLDARVLDLEHHTLLAEKVVGNKPSLKQQTIQQAMTSGAGTAEGSSGEAVPAVESLRGLAGLAREQKDEFLDG
jgi:hypothetical protein